MAELQDPAYLEQGSHKAQGDRLVLNSLVAAPGIVGADDLLVTEKAGTPDMSVDVAAGAVFIEGTQVSHQGMYHGFNDGVVNLPVAAADATNPRIDLVIARVYDGFHVGATNLWALEIVTGVAEATPSAPAVPDNSEVIGEVAVAASATSITNAVITDRRDRSSSPTGLRAIVKFTSTGSFTKADYPWLRAVRVRLVGGGGQGGGSQVTGAGQSSFGSGGGGAGYCEKLYTVDELAASEPFTVGLGGSSGTTDGNDGAASTFKGLTGGGGGGGARRTARASNASSATDYNSNFGGVATGGDLNIPGDDGSQGVIVDPGSAIGVLGGNGGRSHLGAAVQGRPGGIPAIDGRDFGGGGAGAADAGNAAGGSQFGGAGAPGFFIFELYA